MLGFNHTLSGTLVGLLVPAPAVPVAAFGLHFVLDALPHFGRSARFAPRTTSFMRLLLLDAALCGASLGLAIALVPDKWPVLALGAFFATLPDFLWPLNGRVKRLDGFFKFAKMIQWGERPWGWVFEVVYAAIMVSILLLIA